MTLVIFGALLVLCCLPAVLFLGLWRGLVGLQRRPLVTRTSQRAGHTDLAVTWGDVFDAYSDPQQRLLTPPPESNAQVQSQSQSQPPSPTATDTNCPDCGTPNDRIASFCQHCVRKLD